jgi:hypothetical protein
MGLPRPQMDGWRNIAVTLTDLDRAISQMSSIWACSPPIGMKIRSNRRYDHLAWTAKVES